MHSFFRRFLGEVSASMGEVDQPIFDRHVPIGIIFKNEGGRESSLNDPILKVRPEAYETFEGQSLTFEQYLRGHAMFPPQHFLRAHRSKSCQL